MIDESKLEETITIGLNRIKEVLQTDKPGKDQLTQARIASSIIASGIRHEATTNARLGMQIRVASLVLKDTKDRKKYLSTASPELKLMG